MNNNPLEKHAPLASGIESEATGRLLYQKKYSVPEAAKLLDMGETNLRTIVKAGKIAVLRLTGTKVLILEGDLERFLQSNYGTVQVEKVNKSRMPHLPDHVANSKYFKRK